MSYNYNVYLLIIMTFKQLRRKVPRIILLVSLSIICILLFISVNSAPVLFIDKSCPFCEQTVDELKFREFDKKTNLRIKSLEGNSLNQREFRQKSAECEIESSQVGVPLLYYNGECFKGKVEILKELERASVSD